MLAIYESVAYLTPGVAATSADVEVRLVSSGALAPIFSDEAGTALITQPALAFTNAVDGSFKFYTAGADRGHTVTVTKGAATKTITVAIGTAAQRDVSAFVGNGLFPAADEAAARAALGLSSNEIFVHALLGPL